MKLQIKVDDKTGKIVDARFKTFGCECAIASSSLATEWVKGKEMEEALQIKNSFQPSIAASSGICFSMNNREIAKHLSLPPVKSHCSMLAEDAIKAVIKDYGANRGEASASPA